MAEMEGIEYVDSDEGEDYEEEEEEEEEDEEGEDYEREDDDIEDLSLQVNADVTLNRAELGLIYTGIHWAEKSEGNRWSDEEIKNVIGYAIFKLDEQSYNRLDLTHVIKRLRDPNDSLTIEVEMTATRVKKNFVDWFPQLYEKYLEMCGRKYVESVPPLCSVTTT